MRITAPRLAPLALAVGLLLAPTPAVAAESGPDVVVLKDGRRIEGEIVAENERFVSVRADGVLRAYPKSQVEGVTKGERPAADPVPDAPADDARAERKRKKKGASLSKEDRIAMKGKRPGSGELSPAAGEWLDALIGRLARNAGDGDPAVKASLAAAIRALGAPAAPRLRAAAKGSAAGPAEFLNKLAASIEEGARKRADKGRTTTDKPQKGERTMDGPPRRVGQRIIDALGVADADADAVSAAFKSAYEAQRKLGMAVRNGEMAREEAAPQRHQIRADLDSTMRGLLSMEQFAEYQKIAKTLFRGDRYKGKGAKSDKKAKKKKDDVTE